MRFLLVSLSMVFVVGCGGQVALPVESNTDADVTDSTAVDTGTTRTDSSISDSSTTDPPIIDTSTPTTDTAKADTTPPVFDAGGDGAIYGAGCNEVVQKGSLITQTVSSGARPTFTGGTITDGTYVMTKWVAYGGKMPSPTPTAQTLVITGGVWRLAAVAAPYTFFSNATVTTSGTSLTFTPTCPSSLMSSMSSYTATSTELIAGDSAGTDAAWFIKL